MISSLPCLSLFLSVLIPGQQTESLTPRERLLRALDQMNVVVAIWTDSGRTPEKEIRESAPCPSLVIFADGRTLAATAQDRDEPAVAEGRLSEQALASLLDSLRRGGFFDRGTGRRSFLVPDGSSISILVRSGDDVEVLSVWPLAIHRPFPPVGTNGDCLAWDGQREPSSAAEAEHFLQRWAKAYMTIRGALSGSDDEIVHERQSGKSTNTNADATAGAPPRTHADANTESNAADTLIQTLQRLRRLERQIN